MMTLEEVWENLRQDPETKATMEEVEKSYKLFKKIENLIVSDLESKLAKNKKWLASNEGFLENQKLKQQLAEKEDAIKYLKGIKRYDIGEMITANIKLKQSQNQTAIAELEKLKNYLPNIALDIPDMVSYRYLKKQIDQQIRVLKGESR